MKRVLLAFDSFKGCMSSREAAEAAREGIAAIFPDFTEEILIAADGGEGMSEAAAANCLGMEVSCPCHDPLMRPISAKYTFDDAGARAYIDLAAAAGLTLLSTDEKDPLRTTTFGTGEMMADAISRGAKEIFLGLGGSATNDTALGALQALGAKFFDEKGDFISQPICGSMLGSIHSIDTRGLSDALSGGVKIRLLCDVDNPFSGPDGAVAVYAPQKGADAPALKMLEEGMISFAWTAKKCGFTDVFSFPGSGAAGGAGGGLAALAQAEILPGAATLLALSGFSEKAEECLAVFTGEGKSDAQTLHGKLPATVMQMAAAQGVATILLSGVIENHAALTEAGFSMAASINSPMDSGIPEWSEPESADPMQKEVAMRRMRLCAGAAMRNFLDEMGGFRN